MVQAVCYMQHALAYQLGPLVVCCSSGAVQHFSGDGFKLWCEHTWLHCMTVMQLMRAGSWMPACR
jgi:hypothetical protein